MSIFQLSYTSNSWIFNFKQKNLFLHRLKQLTLIIVEIKKTKQRKKMFNKINVIIVHFFFIFCKDVGLVKLKMKKNSFKYL